jgi:hypothetical protein
MDLTLFILFIILIISIYYFIGIINELKIEIKSLNTCMNKSSDIHTNENKMNLSNSIKSSLEFLKNFI